MRVTLVVGLASLVTAGGFFAASALRALPEVPPPGSPRGARWRRFRAQRLDRRSATGSVLTVGLAVVFGVALVVGVVLDMIDDVSGLAAADASVAAWGSRHADSGAIGVLTAITHLGDTVVVVPVLCAAVLVDLWRHRRMEVVAFAAVVLTGEKLIVNGLKALVDRSRPDIRQLVEAVGSSFPSGHSGAAAAVWPAVALILGVGLPRTVRAALAALAVLVAVAVAASRALLGVHWLTDVVAGGVIGYGWFVVVAVAFAGRRRRREPVTEPSPDTAAKPSPERS